MSMPIGVGIVIDDELNSEKDGIPGIVRQLEKKHFPLVKYSQIPPDETIAQFGSVAFLLLDWDLIGPAISDREEGVQVGASLLNSDVEENLSFIEKFHRFCFAPVFIFTNEPIGPIRDALVGRKLLNNDKTDYILLRSKIDLKSEDLDSTEAPQLPVVDAVSSWFEMTPVIKMIAEWNRGLFSAQAKMFNDFYSGSHSWPEVMAASFKSDDTNPTEEMRQVLLRNLAGRLNGLDFAFLATEHSTEQSFPHDAIISVLEKMTVIPDDCLPSNQYGCGDIFVSNDGETLYKINIRCDCDYIHSKDPELFVLNGREVSGNDLAKIFNPEQGFAREINTAYLFPINGGKCIRIQFKDFKRMKLDSVKTATRIGRLQPPYITDIRQRHAQWIQREGFATIPHEVIDRIVEKCQPEYLI